MSELDFFSVALIPYTLSHTTLGERRVGDLVNLEIDSAREVRAQILTPDLRRALRPHPRGQGLSVARLRELGFTVIRGRQPWEKCLATNWWRRL